MSLDWAPQVFFVAPEVILRHCRDFDTIDTVHDTMQTLRSSVIITGLDCFQLQTSLYLSVAQCYVFGLGAASVLRDPHSIFEIIAVISTRFDTMHDTMQTLPIFRNTHRIGLLSIAN